MSSPDVTLTTDIEGAKQQTDFDGALERYYAAADANATGIIKDHQVQLACRDGCSFCCHLRVHARAHEIFVIAAYVRRHFTPEQQAALFTRLREHKRQIAGLTVLQHQTTNLACPLLRDGRCSVYPARPLTCRKHHSKRVNECEHSFNNPMDAEYRQPVDPNLTHAWDGITSAAQIAYESNGFDPNEYELGSALLTALTQPSSSKRWQGRKKTFIGTHF